MFLSQRKLPDVLDLRRMANSGPFNGITKVWIERWEAVGRLEQKGKFCILIREIRTCPVVEGKGERKSVYKKNVKCATGYAAFLQFHIPLVTLRARNLLLKKEEEVRNNSDFSSSQPQWLPEAARLHAIDVDLECGF